MDDIFDKEEKATDIELHRRALHLKMYEKNSISAKT